MIPGGFRFLLGLCESIALKAGRQDAFLVESQEKCRVRVEGISIVHPRLLMFKFFFFACRLLGMEPDSQPRNEQLINILLWLMIAPTQPTWLLPLRQGNVKIPRRRVKGGENRQNQPTASSVGGNKISIPEM